MQLSTCVQVHLSNVTSCFSFLITHFIVSVCGVSFPVLFCYLKVCTARHDLRKRQGSGLIDTRAGVRPWIGLRTNICHSVALKDPNTCRIKLASMTSRVNQTPPGPCRVVVGGCLLEGLRQSSLMFYHGEGCIVGGSRSRSRPSSSIFRPCLRKYL